MKTRRLIITQTIFILSLFLLISNSVQAETTECTIITSVPYTITTQGIYCLKGDLVSSMTQVDAITIATNNVVIDLNGYKIGGMGAGFGTFAHGIYAYQRQNITIRNGTVRGFWYGIWLDDTPPYTTSQAHLIEDIRADSNTNTAILVGGRGNIIRNNQVVSTGGSTVWNNANGISTYGPGGRVLNNDVIETKEQSTGLAYGVYVVSGAGSVVQNNRIGNSSFGTGTSYGIVIYSSTDVLVSNNRVTTMVYGVWYSGSTGKYRDNLTSSVNNPFIGGTDAGNNN